MKKTGGLELLWHNAIKKRRGLIFRFLKFISFFYYIFQLTRVFLYDRRLLKIKTIKKCFIISVGNISVGGTGKTPLVEYISNLMTEWGKKTAVVSRGYGGQTENDKRIRIVTNGKDLLMKQADAGDEPYMLALKLKKIPIILNKNRVNAIKAAVSMFESEVVLLDDAFQRRDIEKNIEILVFDGSINLNRYSMFPSGILRMPAETIRRADICIINKVENSNAGRKALEYIRKFDNTTLVFFSNYKFASLHHLNDDMPVDFSEIKGKDITIFAGIGNISKFADMVNNELQPAALNIIKFQDHHQYTPVDMQKIRMFCSVSDYVITTHKDAVKLKNKNEYPDNLLYSMIKLEFEKEQMFKNAIKYFMTISEQQEQLNSGISKF